MLQPSNFRSGRFSSLLSLGLFGNLTLCIGLLPWFTLTASGQAILLETNPAPQAPSFDIPTEVSPALSPAPEASVPPEVAYEPQPALEPLPAELAPEPDVELAPEPPAPVTQFQPSFPAPPQGCAALLDLSLSSEMGCGPTPIEPEAAPPLPQPAAPSEIANIAPDPIPADIPPARQVFSTPVAPTIPPARQLTAAVPVLPSSPGTSPVIPAPFANVPQDHNLPDPFASHSPVNGNGIVTATLPPVPSSSTPNFTVVKPGRYTLKPLSANPLQWILGSQPMLFPLPIPVAVSSAFGWRQHPIQQHWHLHSGIDFAAPQGTPVVAAYDGQVAIADHVGGYGLSVLLNHDQGQRQTRYAHLSQIFVRPGQTLSQGDVLGSVGSTGNSTGPHLHFETLVKTPNGMVVVDPTEEVKTALISTLTRIQNIAQASQPTATTADPQPIEAAPLSPNPLGNQPPIPVEVIQPLSRHQATTKISMPILTE